jgi:predicted TIM-barrel fold metal-dependent hydrolase
MDPTPNFRQRVPGSREEDAWLSDEQLAQCAPADLADVNRMPIPTQIVSNGEYMPARQTDKQQRVEARTLELAAGAAKKLGVSRRQFLAGTGGMAAALLAMNEVFGRFFDVKPIEMFESAAWAATGAPANLFVFDDQTHAVRGSMPGPAALRAIAQGPTTPGFTSNPFNPDGLFDELGRPWSPWSPALVGAPFGPDGFHLKNYIKNMFLDSQVTVAILSNVTPGTIQLPGETAPRPPKSIPDSLAGAILTAEQTVAVRDFVNRIAGSTRLLGHGLFFPGVGNRDYMQFQIDNYKPDSWKGYNINRAAKVDSDPLSDMQRWQLDDEAVAYPTYELITKNKEMLKTRPGFFNICVHKGLTPDPTPDPKLGHPSDVPKAAKDWRHLNFIIYHSCIQPRFFYSEPLQAIRSGRLRDGVPDIAWTTAFAQLAAPFPNVYGEIGTTFASSVITFPTVCAHILGQLLKYFGPDRVVFGSDSIWYGSPQWQIETLWRFQIPAVMQKRWGYPELTQAAKRKILGLNSARLYGLSGAADAAPGGVYRPVPKTFESLIPDSLKTLMEFPGFATDNLSRTRKEYQAMGGIPSHTRYGWVRRV